jgi:hypothetical protein
MCPTSLGWWSPLNNVHRDKGRRLEIKEQWDEREDAADGERRKRVCGSGISCVRAGNEVLDEKCLTNDA